MSPSSDGRPSGSDTIVAIITPPGQGGIAAVRLAGNDSRKIAAIHFRNESTAPASFKPLYLNYGWFYTTENQPLDEVMAVFMPHGRSYTGLEQVEIYSHGGRHVIRRILEELIASGARPAEPGEFTQLAFLSGRIDLVKAEGVAEIIAADTERSLVAGRDHLRGVYSEHIDGLRTQLIEIMADMEASIDFAEEEIEPKQHEQHISQIDSILNTVLELISSYQGGRIVKEGFKVAIAGRPNAGKSSLFNLLLSRERALVSPSAGTTRDYLTEWIDLNGFAVSLTDTAGLRPSADEIEQSGQARAREQMADCDLLLWLFDLSSDAWPSELQQDVSESESSDTVLVGNKLDLCRKPPEPKYSDGQTVQISCVTGHGIDILRARIVEAIGSLAPDLTSGLVVTSARHKAKLQAAQASLRAGQGLLREGESPELILFEIRHAANSLGEITGHIYTEDILAEVFASFCLGK